MNTAVKIKSCTRASAAGKNEYNLERTKNRDKDILVLEKNEMPKEKISLSKEQKKEIKSLQSKLSTYKKRLAKAIEDGKEKSIKTNQKNIDKISKDLSKIEKSDNRQKHFTEFTVALTNSKKGEYAENWSELALEHFKQEFPTLQVVSAVEHRDQHSPHMHILLHSPDKPITEVLSEKNFINKDTSREAMKSAYSKIAHTFHSFANEKIAHKELKPLQKGRKYVSLGQYKSKGNFEAKKALQSKNNTLPALKAEQARLDKRLVDANIHLKPQEIGDYSLEVHTSKGLFSKNHFITESDIDRKKDSLLEYADKAGEILDTDANSVKQTIGEWFKALEDNSKKTKDQQQPHFKKEPVLKIKPDYFKNWKKEFNEYLKALDKNVRKMIDKLKEKQIETKYKVYNHSDSIKQRKLEAVKKQGQEFKHQEKNQTKQKGMSR